MTPIKHSAAFLRKRKMLLILPVLIAPFISLAFWSMGGGKQKSTFNGVAGTEGLNLQLPDARNRDDKELTKLSYYEKAASDSAKREELLRNDPFYKTSSIAATYIDTAVPVDSNEDMVYRRLASLDRELNRKNDARNDYPANPAIQYSPTAKDVDRLEQMMQVMQQASAGKDPQMSQLDGMLDKIMDIQHPERLSESVKRNSLSHEEKIFAVSSDSPRDNVSLLVNETLLRTKLYTQTDTGFYSSEESPEVKEAPGAIQAVIHDTRTLVNGAIVKIRLLSDVYIDGKLIPKGNFVYGKAMLNGERLNIHVTSIRYQTFILPVSLTVYDLDGNDGVFIPGAITRDAAKESSDRAIQGIALSSINPSVGTQAASAGIEAAKNLLTKKVKLVKVVVKAGYKILLKDKN